MRQKFLIAISVFILLSGVPLAADPSAVNLDKPWLVLRAFRVSYPDEISGVAYDFQERDWFMTVGKMRLYWAGGRLLPKDRIGEREKWRPYVDYLYPESVPDPKLFSADLIRQLNADVLAETRSNSAVYNIAFYNQIYDGATRGRIESHIVRVDCLGKRVSVHEKIVPALKRVEARLYALAATEADVKSFIASIASIEGYNWREIADSPSRSNHSWGIAVDILPKHWGQKNIYWNWVINWNDDWMLIPLERRWMPPAKAIAAFEAEGFVWGGKWLLWDNMHFEYRPELITLQKWGHSGDMKK